MPIQKEFFTDPVNIEKTREDRILLDYYFDWLYNNHRYSELMSYESDDREVYEAKEYYAAMHNLKHGTTQKAVEHIANYLTCIIEKGGKTDLIREKRLYDYMKPFFVGKRRMSLFKYLYDNKKYDEILMLDFSVLLHDPLATYYKFKILNERGEYRRIKEMYAEFIEKPETLDSVFKIFVKNVFTNKVEIEYNYANDKLKQQ